MVQRGRVERVLGVVNHSGETRWRCGRRCARVRRLGGTRVNSPERPGNSSGQHRHEPGPPAMLRRMEHALEVPSGAVRGRIAVKVVLKHRQRPPTAMATKSGHQRPAPVYQQPVSDGSQHSARRQIGVPGHFPTSIATSCVAGPTRDPPARRCRRTPLLIVYHGILRRVSTGTRCDPSHASRGDRLGRLLAMFGPARPTPDQ
jgi:hypothetical protein